MFHMISQLPKPKSKRQTHNVDLDLSDDDDVYNENVNGGRASNFNEYSVSASSPDENNSIDDFINDESIDDQYSSTASTEVYEIISIIDSF